MSREVKELIASLEAERDELVALNDEIQRQLHAREISSALATEVLIRACGGKSYPEALKKKNQLIAEAHDIINSSRKEIAVAISPGIAVIVVGLALVWSFGGITGMFTFTDETFYQYDLGRIVTTDAAFALPITENISSMRLTGSATGTGKATIFLEAEGTRYRLATFDAAQEPPSLLTGFFTAEPSDVVAIADDLPVVLADDATIEVPLRTTEDSAGVTDSSSGQTAPTATPESDGGLGSNSSNETNESSAEIPSEESPPTPAVNEPPAGQTTTDEPSVPEIPLPSTPPTVTDENSAGPIERTQEFDRECQETCALGFAHPPFNIIVEIQGDVQITLDNVVFGVRPAEAAPVQEIIPAPGNNTSNLTTGIQGALGSACVVDSDCNAAKCVQSVYEGQVTAGVCAPSPQYCAANNALYAPGAQLGVSECADTSQKAGWMVRSGEGRFEIKNNTNSTVAVIDKFGTMAVKGTATFGTSPSTEGWVVTDVQTQPQFSVNNLGELLARGTLTERTTPQRTAGGDFIIQDVNGVARAVITDTGNLLLTGDLLTGVNFS